MLIEHGMNDAQISCIQTGEMLDIYIYIFIIIIIIIIYIYMYMQYGATKVKSIDLRMEPDFSTWNSTVSLSPLGTRVVSMHSATIDLDK